MPGIPLSYADVASRQCTRAEFKVLVFMLGDNPGREDPRQWAGFSISDAADSTGLSHAAVMEALFYLEKERWVQTRWRQTRDAPWVKEYRAAIPSMLEKTAHVYRRGQWCRAIVPLGPI
ncbi:MAG: MarR family transcriptional regulator [Bryobacteraceae bacterium]